jgi:hypothetical protein
VHPKLRFDLLQRGAPGARFVQELRLLGIRQRDIFERSLEADASIDDRPVEGFNWGGGLHLRFVPKTADGCAGNEVEITARLPLPPVVGVLVRPWLEAQFRMGVRAASLKDKLAPMFRWYRRGVMRAGEAGLRQHLERAPAP